MVACSFCARALDPRSSLCLGCGASNPHALAGATKGLSARMCPRCSLPCHLAERQGVEIDYCLQCRGIWLDAGELEKIQAQAGAHALPSQPQHHSHSHSSRKDSVSNLKIGWKIVKGIFDLFD